MRQKEFSPSQETLNAVVNLIGSQAPEKITGKVFYPKDIIACIGWKKYSQYDNAILQGKSFPPRSKEDPYHPINIRQNPDGYPYYYTALRILRDLSDQLPSDIIFVRRNGYDEYWSFIPTDTEANMPIKACVGQNSLTSHGAIIEREMAHKITSNPEFPQQLVSIIGVNIQRLKSGDQIEITIQDSLKALINIFDNVSD